MLLGPAASPGWAWQEDSPKPASLARFFPSRDLVAYVEFDGLDAHADLWHKTAAYQLLNQTTTGAMLEEITAQVAGIDERTSPPRGRLPGKDWVFIAKGIARAGFALGVVRAPDEPKPSCIGLVVRGAGRGPLRAALGKLMDLDGAEATGAHVAEKPGGRKIVSPGSPQNPGAAWWIEGDDLAMSLGPPQGVDIMIECLDGTRPDARRNSVRTALATAETAFTPIGLAFLDRAALPPLPQQAVALGLDRLERVEFRWGFDGSALMSTTRLVALAPRHGVLALLDQPTFDRRGLFPLPGGLAGFSAFSLAPDVVYDQLTGLAAQNDPRAQAQFEALENSVSRATGQRLRQDILARLGPRMAFYTVPSKINAPTNILEGLAQGLVHIPRSTVLIELKEPEAFAGVLDQLMAAAQKFLKDQAALPPAGPAAEIRRLSGVKHGYVVAIPPALLPLPAGMRPTILIGKRTLILGTTPAAARAAPALETGANGPPADDPLAGALSKTSSKMVFLHIADPRQSLLPEVIANLPALVQLVGSAASGGMPFAFFRGNVGGAPGKPEFRFNFDPDMVPDPEELRPFLSPSTTAFEVDELGFQLVTRESFPSLNPAALAPVGVALLLPAVQASRTAARRAQSVNNLKQIGLALHNFHSQNSHFPAQAITSSDGKPVLSWRVQILRFLGHEALFKEFKLDEPWNSPHNKALLGRMPLVYAVPGAAADAGMTFYRGFSGEHTLFDPRDKDGVRIATVTDGTSNTIGIVEAKEAVPWTKPDSDIVFDAKFKPDETSRLLRSLGGHFPGGFNTLLLDGSVRFVKESINVVTLRALITRDGGEVIGGNSF
jgi:hypothetical protein